MLVHISYEFEKYKMKQISSNIHAFILETVLESLVSELSNFIIVRHTYIV